MVYESRQVINRSPKYKNKYVHRRSSAALVNLSPEEVPIYLHYSFSLWGQISFRITLTLSDCVSIQYLKYKSALNVTSFLVYVVYLRTLQNHIKQTLVLLILISTRSISLVIFRLACFTIPSLSTLPLVRSLSGRGLV